MEQFLLKLGSSCSVRAGAGEEIVDNWFSTIQNSRYVPVTVLTKILKSNVTLNWVLPAMHSGG